MNDPNHVPIAVNLGTGHDTFRQKPLGMMSFDEEGVFEIRLRGFTGLANRGSHWNCLCARGSIGANRGGNLGNDEVVVFAPRELYDIPGEAVCSARIWRVLSLRRDMRALGQPLLSLASDWVAGAVLVVGGVLSGRNWLRGRQYQVVGWAFMVSLLVHSFLGNLQDLVTSAADATGSTGLVALPLGPYLVIVGLLLVVSVGGLLTTLAQGSSDA